MGTAVRRSAYGSHDFVTSSDLTLQTVKSKMADLTLGSERRVRSTTWCSCVAKRALPEVRSAV